MFAAFLPLQTAACDFMVGSYDLASERLAGDVTGDGVVDLSDFNAIINLMLGKATSEELMADVTGDGMVDIADVNGVINKMLGRMVQTDTLRILAIGNSFTTDALALLPYVMRQAFPNTYLVLGILSRGSASLETHVDYFSHNWTYSMYYKWTSKWGWTQRRYKAPQDAIAEEPWDWVTLQQVSYMSFDYTTIAPYLQPLNDILRQNGWSGKLAWLITPAYPDGSPHLKGLKLDGVPVTYTSDEMMMAIADCARQVMDSGFFDAVLPCGTALQNARHTSLSQYGDWGQLTNESMHLQSGIPMFIEACAAAMALCGEPFEQCHVDVTSEMYAPLSRGEQVGMTTDNQDLAVDCAIQAFLDPFGGIWNKVRMSVNE